MKTFWLTMSIIVFLLLSTIEIKAQTTDTKFNQMELMKQFLATWQRTTDEGSVEILETKLFGEAVIETFTYEVKGEKSPVFMEIFRIKHPILFI